MTRAAVIGAGFGGLAAAVRLRALGYDVTVFEAGPQPGGRARVFRRDGFSFDAGPTVITAPYLLDELFALVNKRREDYFQLLPVDPFYRIAFSDGEHFDYVGDEDRLLAEVARLSPRDVDGYRRLAAHAERIFDVGYTQLAAEPFSSPADMLRIVPDLLRLRAHRSLHGLVSTYLKDPRLRQAFSFQPLLVGGHPYHTPGIYLLIHWLERKWGVHFASGGTAAIIRGLVKLLADLAVEVRLNAPVEAIEIADGAVRGLRLAGGESIPFRMVVANADPGFVYKHLVDAKHRRRHTNRSLGRRRYAMSLFVGYFGTNRIYPDLAHHTIALGPRYRGLLDDIFQRKTLADDFSLYLHAPTRTDTSLAPPGHENFYVLSPVPNQRSGLRWEDIADAYFDRILDSLDSGLLPGVKKSVVTRFCVDPRYFERDLRTLDGSAFGLEPTLRQSAYFRYHNASEDVGNLFFVGAGTHPGAGLPGVLNSAKVLERLVPAVARPSLASIKASAA